MSVNSSQKGRLTDSVETTLREGKGKLVAAVEGERTPRAYSEDNACATCGIGFPELSPQSFSFNSPLGMCTTCNGLGERMQVDPDLELSTDVAETVYFVANEAIANVLKHAQARVASVHVTKVAANVRVTIHDDGVGDVDAARGTGIAGIRARVNAVDGSLTINSPAGGPTTQIAEIPRT